MTMLQVLKLQMRLVCSKAVPHIPVNNGGRYGGRKSENPTQGTKQAG
jgi:hypothetical protein